MNTVCIEPTKFISARSGNESFGYRIYDDNAQAYDNTWDAIPDDDMAVLRLVAESDNEEVQAMLSFVAENQKSIQIGGEFYAFEDIQALLARG
jgi:hypothetical protein